MLLLFFSMSVLSFAQYNPSRNDLGKDCATQDGKLGTWKEVTVTETYSSTEGSTRSNSSSQNFNASVSAEYKATKKASVSGTAGYDNGSSRTNANSNSSTNTTTRSYQDIQCVEDKNANLPQYTPVRW